MGLDQYLIAKIKGAETNNLTGACGGLFPLAPTSDKTEIGYWRKFYKLEELIMECKNMSREKYEQKNCKDIPLSEKDCKFIKSYAEEEMYELEDWWHGDIEKLLDSDDGWDYGNWNKTVQIMKKAIELISNGAKVYYKYWA